MTRKPAPDPDPPLDPDREPYGLDHDREPWAKQRGESRQAFAAFALYRDDGLTRTLQGTARALAEEPSRKGKPESVLTQLKGWSSKWQWQHRADCYDRYLDARKRALTEDARDQALGRITQMGQLMQFAAMRRLAGDPKMVDEETGEALPPIDPRMLEPLDIVRFAEAGAKLELRGLGEATEFVKGAFMISPAAVTKIVAAITDVALTYVPADRQEAFLRDAAAATGGGVL